MRSSLFSTLPGEAGHEIVNQLPMQPVVFGVIAFVVLVFLLAVTWAFKNSSNHR